MRGPPGVLLSLLSLAGCEVEESGPSRPGSSSSTEHPAVARLEWHRAAVPADGTRVRTIAVGAESTGWRISADRHQILRDSGAAEEQYLALLGGEDPLRVTVPLELPIAGFDEVLLRVQAPHGTAVRALFRRGDKTLLVLPLRKCRGTGVEDMWFPVPQTRFRTGRCESMDVEFSGTSGPAIFVAAELWDQPLERLLPAPGERKMVRVGDDFRTGVGLTAASSLTTAGHVEAGGAVLFFSLGVPEHHGGARAEVVAHLVPATGTPVVFPLPEREEWVDCRIPLPFEGPFEARLEVRGVDAALAACVVAEARLERTPSAPAPTVLLVTSDTHRADHLSATGSAVPVRTPALDALAARGILFENCYSSINNTNPSHAALLTGLHPLQHGVFDNFTRISEAAETLGERFQAAGFVTLAAVSAFHLGDPSSGLGQGFDRMSAPSTAFRSAADTLAAVERWLPVAAGLPLFLWVHVFDAHVPYGAPEEGYLEYPEGRDPCDPSLPDLPPEGVPGWMPGVRDAEYVRAQYRASVAYLDAQLQRLFAVPRVREGIVAFTADHGESLGGHGIFWDHQGLYPDTVHVPLILVTPGVTPGTRSSRPVRQIDVGRTLLDLAGLPAAAFPGRSLLDQAPAEQSRVLIAAHERQAAIQDGPWHLILHLVESANPPHARHSVELFHLEADPGCRNDLAQEQRTVASRLRADLLRELAAVSGPGLAGDADLSPETLGQLAALGYVGTDETGARGDLIGCTCEECTRF